MDDRSSTTIVVVAFLSSAVGHIFHNLAEFPVTILWGWETLLPLAITFALAALWYWRPTRVTYTIITGWAIIVIVFGGGSVLPLPVFPFVPDQSLSHYIAHFGYAVLQLPLLWVGGTALRAGKR